MSEIHIITDYDHSLGKVWRALTDPDLIPRWTSQGLGGRTEGFALTVGTKFKFIAKPQPGWRGIVECEVLEVRAPALLRYTWVGDENDDRTIVTYRLEPHGAGTRFFFDHTGFAGIGGFFVSRVLASVRKKMLRIGLPPVLDAIDDDGNSRLNAVPTHARAPQ